MLPALHPRTIAPLNARRDSYWKVLRMAKATGVNLVQAMDDETLDQHDWAAMVAKCRRCRWSAGCARWLARDGAQNRRIPRECANHDRFKALCGEPAEPVQ